MNESTPETLSMIVKEEAKFQRISDAAKIAQRSVESIANMLNTILEDLDSGETVDTARYRESLARIPHLRRVYMRRDDTGESRIIMDIPFPPSPRQEEETDRELAYLRRLQGSQYSYCTPMEEGTMTDAERVDAALNIAFSNAGFDGGHHKQWVIDQMIRALTQDGYDEWVRNWENGEYGPKTYVWDTGIAP